MPDHKAPQKQPETPAVQTDLSAFAHHLDGLDLSGAQKQDMLETLWGLMIQFVDLGFGTAPSQNTCGQLLKIPDQIPENAAGPLNSNTTPDTFNNAANTTKRQKGR